MKAIPQLQQHQITITLSTSGPGFYEFTSEASQFVADSGLQTGCLVLFCQHTSCSLLIQENADPDVQQDLGKFFALLVPENTNWFQHTNEGPDDMPAHIKSALTAVSLSIPVVTGNLALGTWQGIYLFEHRRAAHTRQVVAHLNGV